MLTPVDFVALVNQTLEYAYPDVTIEAEISNLRVSKKKWLYFDLKDEYASVKCFGTVYHMPGPLEDGMLVRVSGQPRLHPQFGFSLNVRTITPAGEGSIKKAAALLEAKLQAEGLFDGQRKRTVPYPPQRIGLITSAESAAFSDFMKVLKARWGGIEVHLFDVQVQGQQAVTDIVSAIEYCNSQATVHLEALVVTRGGGSADDMAAFSSEQVTRAVAGSRIPTLVAIGHERDVSLAELAADMRASTPSNAAELLVPDKKELVASLKQLQQQLLQAATSRVSQSLVELQECRQRVHDESLRCLRQANEHLEACSQLLHAYDPSAALKRGYSLIRKNGELITKVADLNKSDSISIQLQDGAAGAIITEVKGQK